MIISWPGGVTDQGEVAPATCPKCGNNVVMHLIRTQDAIALYFIAVAPYNVNEYLSCPVCKSGLQVRPDQRPAVDMMRAHTATYRRRALTKGGLRHDRRAVLGQVRDRSIRRAGGPTGTAVRGPARAGRVARRPARPVAVGAARRSLAAPRRRSPDAGRIRGREEARAGDLIGRTTWRRRPISPRRNGRPCSGA